MAAGGGDCSRSAVARRERTRGLSRAARAPATRRCGGEVESLLAQQASAGGFLEDPAVAAAAQMVSEHGASLLTGRRLGAYEVHARIGAGGMGEVYRARDTKLGRDVAIKILPRLFTSDPDRLARFEREARVLASLNHPHIGAIYGLEDADGVRALVLELVDGETLADRIARGPIPSERNADHCAADGGRARGGAREGHRPPRSEAGQYQDHS